jgi:hypothetical protein
MDDLWTTFTDGLLIDNPPARALVTEIREGIAAGLLTDESQPIPYMPEPLNLLRPIGVASFRETFDDGDARPAPPGTSCRLHGAECKPAQNGRQCSGRLIDEPDCRECPHSYALHNDLAGCAALESGDGCECPNSKAILRQ